MIIRGDARRIPLRDETVQCVVTSPPYFQLRDYQCGERQIGLESTPEAYIAGLVKAFARCTACSAATAFFGSFWGIPIAARDRASAACSTQHSSPRT